MTELRAGHIVRCQVSKPGMVERVVEIGPDLPRLLLLDRKLLVNADFPDVEDLAPYVRKPGGETPLREWSLGLAWKQRGIEPHIVSWVELAAAVFLRRGVSLVIMEVGSLRHERRRIWEAEGIPGMGGPLHIQVPGANEAVQEP